MRGKVKNEQKIKGFERHCNGALRATFILQAEKNLKLALITRKNLNMIKLYPLVLITH